MTRVEKSFSAVLLVFVLIAVSLVYNRFNMTTDLGAFLPKGESAVERLMVDLLDKGASSNLMFLGITGAEPAQLIKASQDIKERLTGSKKILAVHNSPGTLSEAQQALIRNYRYLLSKQLTSETMSEAGLRGVA